MVSKKEFLGFNYIMGLIVIILIIIILGVIVMNSNYKKDFLCKNNGINSSVLAINKGLLETYNSTYEMQEYSKKWNMSTTLLGYENESRME